MWLDIRYQYSILKYTPLTYRTFLSAFFIGAYTFYNFLEKTIQSALLSALWIIHSTLPFILTIQKGVIWVPGAPHGPLTFDGSYGQRAWKSVWGGVREWPHKGQNSSLVCYLLGKLFR